MFSQLAYWTLVGWCGTVPRKFPPPKDPDDPWRWWYNAGIGLAGGIVGGFLVQNGLGMESLVATSFGAFAGGRIVSEVGASVMNSATK